MATPSVLRPYNRLLKKQFNPLYSALSLGQAVSFSTTAPLCKRKRKTNKDNNKNRGVSTIYRSGPREPLSMSSVPLPKPRDFKPKIKVDENHGLWGFFPAPGKLLWTPAETEEHGRAWTTEELRKKSWEDLHALWWVCCRERNKLATSLAELERSQIGFGNRELQIRDSAVKKTMRSIKHALTERYYTWEDAQQVAKDDPEIDMRAGEGEAYNPSSYVDETATVEDWVPEAEKEAEAKGKESSTTTVDGTVKSESKPEKQTI